MWGKNTKNEIDTKIFKQYEINVVTYKSIGKSDITKYSIFYNLCTVFSIAAEHILKLGACETSSFSNLWEKSGHKSFIEKYFAHFERLVTTFLS